jgi:hypothetical protein
LIASLLVFLLSGCSSPSNDPVSGAPAPKLPNGNAMESPAPANGNVVATDEQIGITLYPGAVEGLGSRVASHTEVADTYSVLMLTDDSPAQVEEFYKKEGSKIGTLNDEKSPFAEIKLVSINRNDGRKTIVKANAAKDNKTAIFISTLLPKKR